MKLSNKILLIILSFTLVYCSKSILLKNINLTQTGVEQFGRTPNRDFFYPINIGDSLNLKWRTQIHGSFNSTSPSIFFKYLFVPDLSGRIYCLNSESGREEGVQKDKGSVEITPVIYRYRIFYVLNEYDEKYSTLSYYDFFTGKYIKKLRFNGSCSNEMIKIDDGIILLTDGGELYKINNIGEKVWSIYTGRKTTTSPALANGKIIFGTNMGELIAVDEKKGKVIYRKLISSGFDSGISISDNIAYVGDNTGNVIAFDIEEEKVIWNFKTGTKIKSTMISDGASVYAGNLKGDVYSIDKINGELNWKISTGGVINITPIVFDDYLVQPDLNRNLFFIDKLTGDVKKKLEYEHRVRMTPVFHKNTLYMGIDKGEVLAYEIIQSD
ncbi:MAG: PQQ-binding-like beta-propeller repeat protein [Melioribacteraceae bacterium]|nr:PQQ-binding-like beta-propeller repeat protein [Melioribacteraceae bacterium]MCF8352954.1 PQQ-binding-like beta-propeller repeat protein [Melioribacteraceae bacterium]MCF8395839.1 PQQ-binding-like beta-propeller repeat protein [Melioribacteraceae bacterium]MCF8417471.1 PQQ-binding-like beta-propeller repeat protein [Melioribacteraceae bacterium]